MSRLVEPQSRGARAAGEGKSSETGLTRIAKYFPGEMYPIFLGGAVICASTGLSPKYQLLVVAIGVVVLAIFASIYFMKWFPHEPIEVRRYHAIISPLTFLAHAFTTISLWFPSDFPVWIGGGAILLMTAVSYFTQPILSKTTG